MDRKNPLFSKCAPPAAAEDRRDGVRFRYEMSVSLRILFPEETFTPIVYDCKTQNVSRREMKVVIDKLPFALYRKLLATTRFARISFINAYRGTKINLTWRIIWLDYRRPDSAEQTGLCYMAVSLDDRENQDLTDFTEFVQDIQARDPGMVETSRG